MANDCTLPHCPHCLELTHLRELIRLQKEAADKALELQASDYTTHFTALNNTAGQLKSMQQTYVTKEVYMLGHEKLAEKIDNLQKLVWTGIGVVLALQILFRVYLHV